MRRLVRARLSALLTSILGSTLQPIPAHALERVVIEGQREWNPDWFDYGPGGVGGGPSRVADGFGGGDSVEVAAWLEKKGDVRCAPNVSDQTRNTTSRSDVIDRQSAALAVFRSIPISQRKDALAGGFLKVTYADGGSEQWAVPFPSFSDGGINVPMPGTLKQGSGVAEPTSCVGA